VGAPRRNPAVKLTKCKPYSVSSAFAIGSFDVLSHNRVAALVGVQRLASDTVSKITPVP
jgi:hypothetical protein